VHYIGHYTILFQNARSLQHKKYLFIVHLQEFRTLPRKKRCSNFGTEIPHRQRHIKEYYEEEWKVFLRGLVLGNNKITRLLHFLQRYTVHIK
jgi:hypothetical protein